MKSRKDVTISDLAAEAGVSASTVSLVLNNKGAVAEETRRRVLSAAERLGYVRQPRRPSEPKLLGLVVESLPHPLGQDPFVSRMIGGVEKAASRLGYHVLLSVVDPDEERPPSFVTDRSVEGLIVVGGGDLTDEYLLGLAGTGIPLVLVDNYLYDAPVPSVTADNLRAGFAATSHLISLGHRRIGFVCGPRKYKPLLERLQGYLMALYYHRIEHDPRLVPPRRSGGIYKGYEETLELLSLDEPPTAIVAVSDRAAYNVVRAIRERGLSIPQDAAVVSFDDLPESSEFDPPLTTVRVPKEEMGEAAVRHLLSIAAQPAAASVSVQLPCKLIVRESCGASLGARRAATVSASSEVPETIP